MRLRTTGECFVELPEALFDSTTRATTCAGIKTVSVTIPCVAGPYTSINCTLTLLRNSVRTSSDPEPASTPGRGGEDPRFRDNFGAIQSIVTSPGQNDSGLFETNLRDERYLPFEGAGAISRLADRAAGRLQRIRLRHDQRRGPAPPIHGARRRVPAAVGRVRGGACRFAVEGARLLSMSGDSGDEWFRFTRPRPGRGNGADAPRRSEPVPVPVPRPRQDDRHQPGRHAPVDG